MEEMKGTNQIKPQYANIHDWEFYSSNLITEFEQSIEEGLDIEVYKDIFYSVSRLPKGEIKKKFGDVLFEVVSSAKTVDGYSYIEPSDIDQIQLMRRGAEEPVACDNSTLGDKIHGAWMGRVCGCMLGKTVEGIRTNELVPFLKETDNYPMHRYILRADLKNSDITKYKYNLNGRI